MAASDHSESLSAQPLLHDFDNIGTVQKHSGVPTLSQQSLQHEHGPEFACECGHLSGQRRPAFWRRLRMALRTRRPARDVDFERLRSGGAEKRKRQAVRWRKRACLTVPVLVVCVFGIIHVLNFLLGYIPLFWDDPAASSLDWTLPEIASADIASHLLDITRDVTPIPCHSHNDYWRRVPLYDALRWGCTGVEADVWLFDQELFVGHSTNALTLNRTFRSMYVDPLVQLLDHKNSIGDFSKDSIVKSGIFDTAPQETLVLLVDFKNDGRDIFPHVAQHLEALRAKGYLTYFNGESTIQGPITVVATGNAPFDLITANSTYRDIFFDAPLDRVYEAPITSSPRAKFSLRGGQGTVGTLPSSHFDSSNSYYASLDFRRVIGSVWWGSLSERQLDLVRGQIRGAHSRGLKARYWSTPKWPIGLRNKIWKLLVEEGVDYLNGDDLQGMTRLDWGVRRHWRLVD